MNKEGILKHFATIGGGTVVILLVNLVTAPLITRLVEPGEYGVQSVFNMYASLAASFLYLGQDQALLRFFYAGEGDGYKRALLYRCIKYPLVLCSVAGAVVIVLKWSGALNVTYGLWMVVCLCIYILILVVDRFASLLLRLTYRSKMFSMSGILSKLAYLVVAAGLLALVEGYRPNILVIATICAALLSMAVNVWAGRDYWNFVKGRNGSMCVPAADLLRYGAPFIVSGGIGAFFNFTDKMAIHAFGTYADVGIYSSALGLASVFSVIQTTFCTLWPPLALEHYEQDPKDKELYKTGHNIITVIVFAAGFTMILAKDIFVILLGGKYREASCLLPFLLFQPVMGTVSETTVLGLYFKKKSNMQVIPPLAACACNLAGNLVLVPVLGGKGAAISTGLSYIVFFTARTVLGFHYYHIGIHLKAYYAITFLAVAYAFYNTFASFNIFTVIGYFICMAALIGCYWNTVKGMFVYFKDFIKQNL